MSTNHSGRGVKIAIHGLRLLLTDGRKLELPAPEVTGQGITASIPDGQDGVACRWSFDYVVSGPFVLANEPGRWHPLELTVDLGGVETLTLLGPLRVDFRGSFEENDFLWEFASLSKETARSLFYEEGPLMELLRETNMIQDEEDVDEQA